MLEQKELEPKEIPEQQLTQAVGGMGNQEPLYIVDGVPCMKFRPEEIESMAVLKDAASTALYGTRGANGLIIINPPQT